jgi:RHS repeat-associated protein
VTGRLWTDYLGEQPYVDYTAADANNPSEVTRYLAGFGVQQAENLGTPGSTVGFQGDMIRSTMLLTDSNNGGAAVSDVTAYTAFGELVTPNSELGTRYAYAGGWGYESGYITLQGVNTTLAPITLQHVGARWYQPGIGRFVQRDPIGIRGGLNAYLYCQANPLNRIDPDGKSGWWKAIGGLTFGFLGGELVYHWYVNKAEKAAEGAAEIQLTCVVGQDMANKGWPDPWSPRNVNAGPNFVWVTYTMLPDGRVSVTYMTRDGHVGQYFITRKSSPVCSASDG